MKKILVAAFSLFLLSSAAFAASNPAADDDDNITTAANPKKVDMRANQNLPAALAGKKVITPEQLQGMAGTVGKTGKNGTPVVIVPESQPGVKVGKFLQSNKNANDNTVQQIPGVPGGVIVQEGNAKRNHKNINSRTDEILGGDSF